MPLTPMTIPAKTTSSGTVNHDLLKQRSGKFLHDLHRGSSVRQGPLSWIQLSETGTLAGGKKSLFGKRTNRPLWFGMALFPKNFSRILAFRALWSGLEFCSVFSIPPFDFVTTCFSSDRRKSFSSETSPSPPNSYDDSRPWFSNPCDPTCESRESPRHAVVSAPNNFRGV